MMRLFVLGSGSRGNCFAVESEGVGHAAGRRLQRARDRARGPSRSGSSSAAWPAIALTHEHGDHASRRAAAGPAPRSPGAHRARDLGPARAAHAARRRTTASASGAASSWGRSASRPVPPATTPPSPLALAVRAADGTSVGVAYDLGRPTAAVRYLLRELTALVLEANHDEVRPPDERLPAGGAAPDRRLGRPPVQPGGRRAAGRAAPSGPRGGGARPPEPALQHGRRRPRDGRPGAPAGRASGASCTWPRRTRRCRRSTWRCRGRRSCDWRCSRPRPGEIPASRAGSPHDAARDPLEPGSPAEWIPRCVAGPTASAFPTSCCLPSRYDGCVSGSGGTGTESGRGVGGPTFWKLTGSFRSPPDSVRFFPFSLRPVVDPLAAQRQRQAVSHDAPTDGLGAVAGAAVRPHDDGPRPFLLLDPA